MKHKNIILLITSIFLFISATAQAETTADALLDEYIKAGHARLEIITKDKTLESRISDDKVSSPNITTTRVVWNPESEKLGVAFSPPPCLVVV